MRYREYLKVAARLEKQINECLNREIRTANGAGPWYVKLFPSWAETTIRVANRKRGVLAYQRATLEREAFGDPSILFNTKVTDCLRRTVPNSSEAVARLQSIADAAIEFQPRGK